MLPVPLKRLFTQPGHKFALLVVLGTVVFATPMAEVWRRQGLELQTAFDARRALESMTLAVQTQRTLSAHRPYAAAVLAGRSEQEPERLRRQQAVDNEVGGLVATLEAHRLHRALDEADQLRNEWTNLLEGIGRRQMRVATSDAAHDLLVEQVFVIMDLAAGAGGLHSQVGRSFRAEQWTLALQTLPRFAAALALSAADTEPMAEPQAAARRTAALARRVAKAAEDLLATADAADADEPAPDRALVHALVALRQSATLLSEAPSPAAPAARRALATGLEASAALIATLDAGLVESISVLRRERLLVAVAGILSLLIGGLAAALALAREASSSDEFADTDDGSDAGTSPLPLDTSSGNLGAESQGPASDLLQRLRRQGIEADSSSTARPKPPGRH